MIGFIAMTLLAALTLPAHAQSYPSKPIRIVVPFTPGGGSDIVTRVISPKLVDAWGQQVVVDNRAGAGGTIGAAIVSGAMPDGHTLLITSSAFAGAASLYPKLPYDTIKDFAPIALVASTALILVVAPSTGPRTVSELVALARQKPGQINYASAGIGSGTHYAGELFKLAGGINVVHVPYRGVPEALTDTLTGRTHYYLSPILSTLPLLRDGRLLALGVSTRERAPLLPEVPTIAEAGLPGYEYDGWFGVLAPAAVPRAVIDKLSRELMRITTLPDVRDRFEKIGGRARASTPGELAQLIRAEIENRRKVFAAAGAKAE
jgi:tripartite-type tricarboxylate transporter receptor subunit TctC